jgi:hypothetical protein
MPQPPLCSPECRVHSPESVLMSIEVRGPVLVSWDSKDGPRTYGRTVDRGLGTLD